MTKIIGRLQSVGIGRESSRGTAVEPQYWLKPLEMNVDIKSDIVHNTQGLGRIEGADDSAVMKQYGEIGIKTKLHEQSIGMLLLAALGQVSTSGNGDASGLVYDHTFTPLNTNSHPSLTIGAKNSNEDVAYPLAMLESLTLEATPDDFVTVQANFLSKKAESASQTVSHITEKDFIFKHLTFKHAADQSSLGGASEAKIRAFSLTIAKNLSAEYESGSLEPSEILNQMFDVTGNVVVRYDGDTYQDYQNDETDRALRFDFVHSDTIGTSANPELLIDLYKVRLENYARDFTLDNLVEESFDFKGLYSLSDSAMIRAVLTNLVEDYDAA